MAKHNSLCMLIETLQKQGVLTKKEIKMNRELARIIVCLMDEKLNLPSTILESLEDNLVYGNFNKVYEYYCKRLAEVKRCQKSN